MRKFFFFILLLVTMASASALTSSLDADVCSATGCSVSELNTDDTGVGMTVGRGDTETVGFADVTEDISTINNVNLTFRHSGENGISGSWTVVAQSVDGGTQYCTVTVFQHTSGDTTDVWDTSPDGCGWTLSRLNDLEFAFTNNDAQSPDNAYLYYTNVVFDYTPNNAPSTWTVNLNSSPSTLDAGNNITYTGTGTDAEGDNYRMTVCSSNHITDGYPGTCSMGGPGSEDDSILCTSSEVSSGSEASCVYTTDGDDTGTLQAYAFLCDSGSSSCSSGTTDSSTVESPDGYLNVSILSPSNNTAVIVNETFWLNASVVCSGPSFASCGDVNTTARYTNYSAEPDTTIGNSTELTLSGDLVLGEEITKSTGGSAPSGIFFKSDGTKMYEVDAGSFSDDAYEFSCSEAWKLDSCSFTQQITIDDNVRDVTFSSDGSKMYTVDVDFDLIFQYSCSDPWNLSTCSKSMGDNLTPSDVNTYGIEFKNDGSKFYEAGLANDQVVEYECLTPWEISTCSTNSVVMSTTLVNPRDIQFGNNGERLYIVSFDDDHIINQYSCSESWNLSSCVFDGVGLNITLSDFPASIQFKNSGESLYVLDSSGDSIYAYNCVYAWDITSCEHLDWMNDSFSNRQFVEITHDKIIPRYTLPINVSYQSEMQTDFDDVIFYTSSGIAEHIFHDKVDGSWAEFYVTFDVSNNTRLHMYYGNSSIGQYEIHNPSSLIFYDGFTSFDASSPSCPGDCVSDQSLTYSGYGDPAGIISTDVNNPPGMDVLKGNGDGFWGSGIQSDTPLDLDGYGFKVEYSFYFTTTSANRWGGVLIDRLGPGEHSTTDDTSYGYPLLYNFFSGDGQPSVFAQALYFNGTGRQSPGCGPGYDEQTLDYTDNWFNASFGVTNNYSMHFSTYGETYCIENVSSETSGPLIYNSTHDYYLSVTGHDPSRYGDNIIVRRWDYPEPTYTFSNESVSENPKSLNTLTQGESSNTAWVINFTGDLGSEYYVDVLFTSSRSGVADNDTSNIRVYNETQAAGVDTDFDIWNGTSWVDSSTEFMTFRCTPTQTDCEPQNQDVSSTQSIYRITNSGGAGGSSVVMSVDTSFTGIDLKCDDDYTSTGATVLTTSNQTIHGTLAAGNSVFVSCWADYSNPTFGGPFNVSAFVVA